MALPNRATQKQIRLPAPVGGNNTLDNVLVIGPTYTYINNNFISRPFGLEIRKGYREWLQKGASLVAPAGTLMTFSNPGASAVKLFAACEDINNSVYDISAPNTVLPTPLPLAPPSVQTSFQAGSGATYPGEWSSVNYNTPTKAFLCAVLFGKGYYTFDTAAGWVKVPTKLSSGAPGASEVQFEYPTGTFHDASTMMFVFSWKSRLWFLQGGTGLAWFLPVNAVYGKAGVLDLGQFMTHGGGLAYAMGWTYDSGAGMDDALVFVSNNGDMVIYQGTDPSDATKFALKGTWFVGRVPKGRKAFCDYGGDVLIVTEYGINSVSDFVSGRLVNLEGQSSIAEKYNPTIARSVSKFINDRYWALVNYPVEELIVLLSPVLTDETQQRVALAMSHFGKSWTTITEMEPYAATVYEGQFVFSGRDNKVYQGFYGYLDKSSYDATVKGSEVTGQFQTGFFDYGSGNSNKRATRVRILGRADGLPAYVLSMEPEYQIAQLPSVGAPALVESPLWNVAIWDRAMWASKSGYWAKWFGIACVGKRMSLLAAVRGTGYTLVTDYEVTYEEGIGL